MVTSKRAYLNQPQTFSSQICSYICYNEQKRRVTNGFAKGGLMYPIVCSGVNTQINIGESPRLLGTLSGQSVYNPSQVESQVAKLFQSSSVMVV